MSRVLVDAQGLEQAERLFVQSARSIPHQSVNTVIGYQGGTFETEVMWFPSLGLWAYFGLPPSGKSEAKRFWNAFGEGWPGRMVSITCEVNPSREGINRRTRGAFVVSDSGKVLACHRGAFNIRGGMTAAFFRQQYKGAWLRADEGSRVSSFVSVAELGSSDFGASLSAFVHEVARIKDLARSR